MSMLKLRLRPRLAVLFGLALWAVTTFGPRATPPALAQTPGDDWSTGVNAPPAANPGVSSPPSTTTVVPRTGGESDPESKAEVQLMALLTADGQRIDKGIVWRVYRDEAASGGKPKLLSTLREAGPVVKLEPGDYIVNAAFGRAHLTRKLKIEPAAAGPIVERFVLNAGGLRVTATVSGAEAAKSVTYSIYSDRDQTDNRRLIMSGVRPGLIIRLNAGIYQIVSSYGDANAVVRSDVTVEAGKLTEATISHAAAKVTLKLVTRAGGEALADTQWTIQTPEGRVVKESMGALPTHVLAPGSYLAVAKSQGKVFNRDFTVRDGEQTQIEVIVQ